MRWLAVACAVALPIIAVGAFAATRDHNANVPTRAAEGPYRGSEPPGRNLLPSFRLPTYDGRTVSSRALRGRVVVTTFVDSSCKQACPIIVAALAAGLRQLDATTRRQVTAVAFSVDPKVDTRRHVRTFLRARRAEAELAYAVAPEKRMRPVWRAFHILPAVDTGSADTHSADVRVFDRHGVWVSTLHAGLDLTQANLAHDIRTVALR
jgi:cytochrome oxidase Cu insertion factor (SCO1/SenC/PrrC family)